MKFKNIFQHLTHISFIPFLACGSSFDSYNSFGLNPLSYNSQTSFNASNTSFNTTTNTSLLDQTYGGGGGGVGVAGGDGNNKNAQNSFNPSSNNNISGGIQNPSYVQTQSGQQSYQPKQPNYQPTMNLQTLPANMSPPSPGGGNYSPNSSATSYSQQYDPQTYGNVATGGSASTLQNQTTSGSGYETSSYDNLVARSTSIDEHMKQQLDEQLLTKVSQMALEQVTKLLAEKQRELQSTSNIIRSQIQSSREILAASSGNSSNTTSARDLSDREEFC